jgi:ribosomal protein S18 acetylase RimI-like enzyme
MALHLLKNAPEGSLRLRPMRPADAAALSALAYAVWRSHYRSILSEAQIEYMLEALLSESALLCQLEEAIYRYTLAEWEGTLAGFIAMRNDPDGAYISKLYTAPALQEKGIGAALLAHAAQGLHAGNTLRLNVNRYNRTAVEYYLKRGFRIERETDDTFGPYILNDYVMAKPL